MNQSTQLGLIVAYFLSKYDRAAVKALGYENFTEAFEGIGAMLQIKPNYLKNMRDHFDPLHPWRAGWYQDELGPRHIKVIELFSDLSFVAFSSVVNDLLQGKHRDTEDIELILTNFDEEDTAVAARRPFVPRAITGQRAEEYFMICHESRALPFLGKLIDRRNDGCGYDFKIIDGEEEYLVEVKGLANISGGISLTDKEWETANTHPNYKLFIAFYLDTEEPDFKIIDSPATTLKPTKTTRTTVQVSWNVSVSDLNLESS